MVIASAEQAGALVSARRRVDGPAGSLILVEENHDLPLVRVQVAVRIGAGDDAPGDDGLTNFASELMGRGAGGRTRAEIDAAFDALGTSLDVGSDYDGVTFELDGAQGEAGAGAGAARRRALAPRLSRATRRDKLKRELRAQLDELRDDDGTLARRFFTRALFGAHPYGRTVIGTEASIDAR